MPSFLLQTSDTHTKMIEILEKTGFSTQEFILSPMQFGVPYSRPRYFCLVAYIPRFHFSLFLPSFYFIVKRFAFLFNFPNMTISWSFLFHRITFLVSVAMWFNILSLMICTLNLTDHHGLAIVKVLVRVGLD